MTVTVIVGADGAGVWGCGEHGERPSVVPQLGLQRETVPAWGSRQGTRTGRPLGVPRWVRGRCDILGVVPWPAVTPHGACRQEHPSDTQRVQLVKIFNIIPIKITIIS